MPVIVEYGGWQSVSQDAGIAGTDSAGALAPEVGLLCAPRRPERGSRGIG